ncbi:MAG: hypothetical protein QNK15_11895, partial [Cycloclasticus sp.]|nr:hypothetical protein [Cycloclasticus sp.]
MKNQFGYRLIKVKGILCSGAFFLGMMMSMSAAQAAVTVTGLAANGIPDTTVLVEDTDLSAAVSTQLVTDTAQDGLISTNSSGVSTNVVDIATNSSGVSTNVVDIATNSS